MKNQQLMEELEKSMDDKVEKDKLMEGFLGYIICSTQVNTRLSARYLCFVFHIWAASDNANENVEQNYNRCNESKAYWIKRQYISI